jgi:hypothetical protein
MTKTKDKDELKQHMRFISVVPIERPGVIEFQAWKKAQWLYVWMKPWNERQEIPHLAFLDCPTLDQVTYRMLALEGQAQIPIDEEEEWVPMSIGWPTRRSFCTLWMSQHCYNRTKELRRGRAQARVVKAAPLHKPDLSMPEEEEAYIP